VPARRHRHTGKGAQARARRHRRAGRVQEKIELYSMHLGKFKEGTCIIGIALTVGEHIGAIRRPVPWLRCPPVFFY